MLVATCLNFGYQFLQKLISNVNMHVKLEPLVQAGMIDPVFNLLSMKEVKTSLQITLQVLCMSGLNPFMPRYGKSRSKNRQF